MLKCVSLFAWLQLVGFFWNFYKSNDFIRQKLEILLWNLALLKRKILNILWCGTNSTKHACISIFLISIICRKSSYRSKMSKVKKRYWWMNVRMLWLIVHYFRKMLFKQYFNTVFTINIKWHVIIGCQQSNFVHNYFNEMMELFIACTWDEIARSLVDYLEGIEKTKM